MTSKKNFTIAELVLVTAAPAILGSMVLAVQNQLRDHGRLAVCQTNLKQIGVGMLAYSADFGGQFTTRYNGRIAGTKTKMPWNMHFAIHNYMKIKNNICPNDANSLLKSLKHMKKPVFSYGWHVADYGYNHLYLSGLPVSKIKNPAAMVAVTEARLRSDRNSGYYVTERGFATPWPIHEKYCGVLFADGHVKAVTAPGSGEKWVDAIYASQGALPHSRAKNIWRFDPDRDERAPGLKYDNMK